MRKYHYTVGLTATSSFFKKPMLVKVCIKDEGKGSLTMTVESGWTMAQIERLGRRRISREDFENRPTGYVAEARWAFEKFGLNVCEQ